MDLYQFSFGVLTAANSALAYIQYRSSRQLEKSRTGNVLHNEEKQPIHSPADENAVREFQKSFFGVYILVVAADWLQGPYMYSLYKDEKGLSERHTAFLFAIGFVSAAISAGYVGTYADEQGRKKACLGFCITYGLSCLSVLSNSNFILLIGRALGGVSTTLMYSVFETWMVHEFHVREMGSKGMQLGKIFGTMTTVSSVVAVLSGVIGEALVDWSGTKIAPFMAALVCLTIAFVSINNFWPENYGNRNVSKETGVGGGTDIATIIKDKRIFSLGLICCLFEGTMFIFVFFWSAALKSARSSTRQNNNSPPPFGLIFATFMSAMMLGSQLFTIYSSSSTSSSTTTTNNNQPNPNPNGPGLTISTSVQNLSYNLLLSSASLLVVVFFGRREELTLWAFCAFEACVGLYYPSMGFLKGQIVHDGVRGKVYGLMRLPLNLFVVVTLGLTVEGDRHRDNVFLGCSWLLLVAFGVGQKFLT